MKKTIIMIPARLGSTRFPNKPLAEINGKPMILRVCAQAKKTGIEDIIVACSEDEVRDLVESNGYKAIMTDPDLPSGTDRIYAALEEMEDKDDVELIVNLQGDLPNIDPEIISKTVDVLNKDKDADIATAVTKIEDDSLRDDPNVVKAVVNFDEGREFSEAHYFSRSVVPYNAQSHFEHIGLYVYRKDAIRKFVSLPESPLEKCEKLEQLRAIENGMKISACLIPAESKPVSVDTPEDIKKL